MTQIFKPPRGAVEEPPYRKSCYGRWGRKMEILHQKKERRRGQQDKVGVAEEGQRPVTKTWWLLNLQNQKQPGVQTSVDQSIHQKRSTSQRASKVWQNSRNIKHRREKCQAAVDHMTWPHPPAKVEPHPLEIDLTEGIGERKLAVPLTEQVRVHHRAKRGAPLIIAKEDGKERERNRHFKIETHTITTTDHTTGKRTQEEREMERESTGRVLLLLGQPDWQSWRDWLLQRMKKGEERKMSIIVMSLEERDIPLQGENNLTIKIDHLY